jgi:prepilin-type N-terminal cleavage/methylation domain-containing protein
MRRPTGFTLLEVMVAIVITGVVALLAYGTASAGFDTRDRLKEYQVTTGAEIIVRAFLLDALRHPPEQGGIAMNDTLFWIEDEITSEGLPADAVLFLSRGVASPLGASNTWAVELSVSTSGLRLYASPISHDDHHEPITMLIPEVQGLNIEVLDRSTDTEWQQSWDAPGRVPAAVRLDFVSSRNLRAGSPVVVHSALEIAR